MYIMHIRSSQIELCARLNRVGLSASVEPAPRKSNLFATMYIYNVVSLWWHSGAAMFQ